MQYLEREASSRKELQSWEARFAETQRRADWLQEQLDSNSREKTELFKQAGQFQQLLLQKERSLQKILEEKQELQQQLQLLEEQAISETSELETPPVVEKTPSVEHEEELLSETEMMLQTGVQHAQNLYLSVKIKEKTVSQLLTDLET